MFYYENLNHVNKNVEELINQIKKNFEGKLYFETDQCFHIAAGENTGEYPNCNLIAYGGFGIFDNDAVSREFVLNKLFKKDYPDFLYNKLFMPKYNSLDSVSDANKLYKLQSSIGFRGDALYLCRCSHFNMTKRDNKEYRTSLNSRELFDIMINKAYEVYHCSNDTVLKNKECIGAIELEIINEKDLKLALDFLKYYFTSREFLSAISTKRLRKSFKEFQFKY